MSYFILLYATLTGFRLTVKANRLGCDSVFARTPHDKLTAHLEDAIKRVQRITTIERGGSGNLHMGDKWNFCLTLA
ncbi:hypothetical protein [Ochrobactrum sp. BTU1]|uniref:hypothetical protein n=1 Tax=Ochrobactrum sp. BTU1 TaxID=2840456 RepID=UPI001C052510|nr:hypothetical protein KMS41_25970 [Ochrobactrum sp. BTU1]